MYLWISHMSKPKSHIMQILSRPAGKLNSLTSVCRIHPLLFSSGRESGQRRKEAKEGTLYEHVYEWAAFPNNRSLSQREKVGERPGTKKAAGKSKCSSENLQDLMCSILVHTRYSKLVWTDAENWKFCWIHWAESPPGLKHRRPTSDRATCGSRDVIRMDVMLSSRGAKSCVCVGLWGKEHPHEGPGFSMRTLYFSQWVSCWGWWVHQWFVQSLCHS